LYISTADAGLGWLVPFFALHLAAYGQLEGTRKGDILKGFPSEKNIRPSSSSYLVQSTEGLTIIDFLAPNIVYAVY